MELKEIYNYLQNKNFDGLKLTDAETVFDSKLFLESHYNMCLDSTREAYKSCFDRLVFVYEKVKSNEKI